ncbi:nicotinamidase [Geosmithia morbida]|uniref:nicotinamidase n=1 Tax=Geosmithia morbida TaxID=1094350 RepID=A0A9P4YXC7_9HYPO|nr:nicotinamidase [Geosmithia morbida]KAF4124821.1 nicotinamidase [Geosmithia morbida]
MTTTTTANLPFSPALIVNGSLAVPGGRDIAPAVNQLLRLPFVIKVATRDWHPQAHISFATNHHRPAADSPPPQPFTSSTDVVHPSDASRSYTTTLWPVHCVAGTPGAQLVPELELELDGGDTIIIDKGRDPRVEMYSAFYDPFRLEDSGLAGLLRDRGVTHVYVVGLAADYCVKATAEHALQEGFDTCIVADGTRPVAPDAWPSCLDGIVASGVRVVDLDGDDVARVRARASS